MAIYIDRVNNSLLWRLTDSVVIVEQEQPAPVSLSNSSGLVGMVADFPWGPVNTLVKVRSPKDILAAFGAAADLPSYGGYRSLTGKAWPQGSLYYVRVSGTGAAKASRTIEGTTPDDLFKVVGKHEGAAGNEITTLFTKVDLDTFNLTITWNAESVTYTNLPRSVDAFAGINPDHVDLVWLDTAGTEPLPDSDLAPVALAGGTIGTLAATDWEGSLVSLKGLRVLRSMPDGGIILAGGGYTGASWAAALALHTAAKNAHAVLEAEGNLSFADAILFEKAVANERLRVMTHPVTQFLDGGLRVVDLSAFYASTFAGIHPSESAAQARWKVYLQQVQGVAGDTLLERAYWIESDDAGGIMLEQLATGGYKFHMDITSDPADGKTSSLRRRMHDYVNDLLGRAAEPFLNRKPIPKVLRQLNTVTVKALADEKVNENIEEFTHTFVSKDGASSTWQTKVKLFGEMRNIIITSEVGENVTFTEEDAAA